MEYTTLNLNNVYWTSCVSHQLPLLRWRRTKDEAIKKRLTQEVYYLVLFTLYMATINLVSAQDTTAILKPKFLIEYNATHNFSFGEIYTPYNTPVPSAYAGYNHKYYWQHGIGALYNIYKKKQNLLRNISLSTGIKINYEKNSRVYDTADTTYPSVIIIDEKEQTIRMYLPIYIGYTRGAFTFRSGIVFSVFAFTSQKYTHRNNTIIKNSAWALFPAYNYLSLRMDYTLPLFRKSNPYFFCYYNGYSVNEFGGGVGMSICYNK